MVKGMLKRPPSISTRFHCVTPSWDNSARRKRGANIFTNSSPKIYEEWLRKVAKKTVKKPNKDEHVVFINAWNEWAEGNHLEPDLKWGHAYLSATKRALQNISENQFIDKEIKQTSNSPSTQYYIKFYWSLINSIKKNLKLFKYLTFRR